MNRLMPMGERIMSRDPGRQTAEIQIRIAIMNRCSAPGQAEIEAAGQSCWVRGAAVRFRLAQQGLSQEEPAFDTDLHRTYVGGVERGIRNPTVLIVAKLAAALGVEPSKLLEFRG